MDTPQTLSPDGPAALEGEPKAGWKPLALVASAYFVVLAVALHGLSPWDPVTQLPNSLGDSLLHLWTMRWYKSCLLEGRLPWFCPGVEYPVGAPLGNFSPMHLQSLLYLVFSCFTSNDILIYNVILALGFVLTGFGTYVLAWRVTGDRGCSFFAGVAAMLSAPMIHRGAGTMEMVFVGGFPLFLIAWMRFVDEPTRRRLWLSVLGFWLVSACAAYFMVFVVFPASLYVLWAWAWAFRAGDRGWVRGRLGWLLRFSAVTGAGLLVLFSGNIWSALHGFPPVRKESEFLRTATLFRSYLFPHGGQHLERFFPYNPYRDPSYRHYAHAYLGLSVIVLLAYAAVARVKVPRGRFWWLTLAMLVVLAMGAYGSVGGLSFTLPSYWLRQVFPPFWLLRDADRFNLFVPVVASVLAAAGLRHLLRRVEDRAARGVVLASLVAFTVYDLGWTYPGIDVRPMPACYEKIKRLDPGATFLEVYPQKACSTVGYWQSFHRCPSTVSFTGLINPRYLSRVGFATPIGKAAAEWDRFLADSDFCSFPGLYATRFRDYLWLFMKTRHLRYLVLHKKGPQGPWDAPGLANVEKLIERAKVYEDEDTAVYGFDQLATPEHVVMVPEEGWMAGVYHEIYWVTKGSSRLMVYNPDETVPVRLGFQARANGHPRRVRLMEGASRRELARWRVSAGGMGLYSTPPLKLPKGLVALRIESGPESPMPSPHDDVRPGPFSLRFGALDLEEAPVKVASMPEADPTR